MNTLKNLTATAILMATMASANASNSEVAVSLDDKLSQLQALGFTLAESQLALTQADGEVNLAATLLFSSR